MVKLNKRPLYKGLVIPYIVMVKEDKPFFKLNDSTIVQKCIKEKLCSVCGGKLENDKWLIGGPASAFHKQGAYVDIPVHKECAIYSLTTCPYMAYTQYTAKEGVSEKLKKEFPDVLLYNPTIDSTRLQYFVLVKIIDYVITPNQFIRPIRPYLEIEYWKDGKQINNEEVVVINIEHSIKNNEFDYLNNINE
jgi:hypothetical protein